MDMSNIPVSCSKLGRINGANMGLYLLQLEIHVIIDNYASARKQSSVLYKSRKYS